MLEERTTTRRGDKHTGERGDGGGDEHDDTRVTNDVPRDRLHRSGLMAPMPATGALGRDRVLVGRLSFVGGLDRLHFVVHGRKPSVNVPETAHRSGL